ncbi:MAG: hypothetical protein C0467_16880 [Planctomycetaceae bacterium]|nr:hypothetical protein [Planctomycetaceae bacterium]
MLHSFRLAVGLLVCSLIAVSGCAQSMHPVQGTVRFADGTPLKVGRIVIDSPDGKTGSWGAIREDGSFEMGTLTPNDGVPAGTYQVYLTNTTTPPPADLSTPFTPRPLVHVKFNSKETSGITFEVPRQTTWDIVVEKP